MAVAVDEGLTVPVIRDADQLSIHGLNVAIADVANRAKAGKFKVDDFGGGTFTVDNTGLLPGHEPRHADPQRAGGRHRHHGDHEAPRRIGFLDAGRRCHRDLALITANMVLGVDHRANDGAGGAALLRDISLARVGRTGDADLLTAAVRPRGQATRCAPGALW